MFSASMIPEMYPNILLTVMTQDRNTIMTCDPNIINSYRPPDLIQIDKLISSN